MLGLTARGGTCSSHYSTTLYRFLIVLCFRSLLTHALQGYTGDPPTATVPGSHRVRPKTRRVCCGTFATSPTHRREYKRIKPKEAKTFTDSELKHCFLAGVRPLRPLSLLHTFLKGAFLWCSRDARREYKKVG